LLKVALNTITLTLYIKVNEVNLKMCPAWVVSLNIQVQIIMYYSLNGEYETALYRPWFVIYRPRWPFKAGGITFWQIILGENESWPILDDLFFSSF
jgi:hypothetical protein